MNVQRPCTVRDVRSLGGPFPSHGSIVLPLSPKVRMADRARTLSISLQYLYGFIKAIAIWLGFAVVHRVTFFDFSYNQFVYVV